MTGISYFSPIKISSTAFICDLPPSTIIRSGTVQINQTWQCISGTVSQVDIDPLVFSQNTGIITNQLNVNKNPNVGEFSTIYAAVQSISSSSSSNRYVVSVGPGIYIEQQINTDLAIDYHH